jgi:hypothetical protein
MKLLKLPAQTWATVAFYLLAIPAAFLLTKVLALVLLGLGTLSLLLSFAAMEGIQRRLPFLGKLPLAWTILWDARPFVSRRGTPSPRRNT